MAQNVADRVRPGGKKDKSSKKEKNGEDVEKEKIEKVPYVDTDAAESIRNADGKLTSGTLVGYDRKIHKAPKKGDFMDEADFTEYKAGVYERRGHSLIKHAEAMRESADIMRKFGDPATRAKHAKLQKLNALRAELMSELGMDDADAEAEMKELDE